MSGKSENAIKPGAALTIDALHAALPPGERLIGLDVGTKTVGLALSDVNRSIASPLETVARAKFKQDAARIGLLAREHGAGGLVIGLPLNLDGSEGPRVQSTRAFARALYQELALPYAFWDERLSTAAVERAMLAADMSRKRRAEKVDMLAAAYLLQGALDRLNYPR